jgi:membrane protein implicated in regulation of membrane protease activity
MPWWAWIVVGAALLAAEAIVTTDFWLFFVGISALLVGLLGLTGAELPVWAQWLAFAALSVVLLAFVRRRLRQTLARAGAASESAGDVIGSQAVAREPIAAGARGRGELRGSPWQMVNAGSDPVANGDRCTVERVEGVTLYVRRVST